MSNRLTKTDFLVVYAILISISLFIAGFFLGANVGQKKAEEAFSSLIEQFENEDEEGSTLEYSHTDFVSYYYQVFLPFKEFRHQYLSHVHQLSEQSNTAVDDTVDELLSLLRETKQEMVKQPLSTTSPLLSDSRDEYINALDTIEEGLNAFVKEADVQNTDIRTYPPLQQGQEHWLKGQSLFYEALVVWESLYVTKESPALIETGDRYSIEEWNELSFHQKNEVIAKVMESQGMLTPFNPEDAHVYIQAYANRSEESISINEIEETLEFLIATDAIRQGAFLEQSKSLDAFESPTIPLFSQ